MLLVKGHDHGELICCLLPVQQLHKPEPPTSVVLERSKELQENVKSTDDTNKQCPVGCTPGLDMMYPKVRDQHKSLVLIQKIVTGSAGKGNGPRSEHTPA